MPDGLALAEAEEVLRRQVEIRDDEILVEGDDGNAEPAENAFGTECPVRRSAGSRGRRGG